MSESPDPVLTDEQYRGMYEGFYARAGDDLAAVPWAALRPHPALVDWLGAQPPPAAGGRALVIGCGLGDDAEHVATLGYAVTAFDFSPTAIDLVRRRFLRSPVEYRVADLFALPKAWAGAFDLVVEIRTLQSMPADRRTVAAAAIAATIAPGGALFVHSFGADGGPGDGPGDGPEGAQFDGPPWPVTAGQLAGLADAGLVRTGHAIEPIAEPFAGPIPGPIAGPAPTRAFSFTSIYRRAGT